MLGVVEQLDQSLRGAGQGGPPCSGWLTLGKCREFPSLVGRVWGVGWEEQGRVLQAGWLLYSGPNPSPLGSEEVRSVSKNSEFFCCRMNAQVPSLSGLLMATVGYGATVCVWVCLALCEPQHTCKDSWV